MHTKSYNLVNFASFQTSTFFQMHAMGGSRGGQGVRTPLKNHKNIGFPSNIDPDPLKITKLPSQHSMVGHYRQWLMGRWWSIFSGISVLSHYPSDKMFWIRACMQCAWTGSIEIKLSTDIIHARIQKVLSKGIQLWQRLFLKLMGEGRSKSYFKRAVIGLPAKRL